eukprot:scaffold52807_cov27-Cyclotella_meneghiniana.AAC.1
MFTLSGETKILELQDHIGNEWPETSRSGSALTNGGLRSVAQQVVRGEINAEILSLSAYAGSLLNIEGTVNIDVRSKVMMKIERGLWIKVMMNKYPVGLGFGIVGKDENGSFHVRKMATETASSRGGRGGGIVSQ